MVSGAHTYESDMGFVVKQLLTKCYNLDNKWKKVWICTQAIEIRLTLKSVDIRLLTFILTDLILQKVQSDTITSSISQTVDELTQLGFYS